jgi:hypothetical protein
VHSQLAGLRVRLPAYLADVRFLPRVNPHMLSKVGGLVERPAARPADMRPLTWCTV